MPRYEIRVRGALSKHFETNFHPFESVRLEGGGVATVMHAEIPDQSALHGVLRRLEKTGVVLLSLRCLDEERLGHA